MARAYWLKISTLSFFRLKRHCIRHCIHWSFSDNIQSLVSPPFLDSPCRILTRSYPFFHPQFRRSPREHLQVNWKNWPSCPICVRRITSGNHTLDSPYTSTAIRFNQRIALAFKIFPLCFHTVLIIPPCKLIHVFKPCSNRKMAESFFAIWYHQLQ